MHAAIDTLTREGDFSPKASLALVKAMGIVIEHSQLVTVPVLDSRFAEFRADVRIQIAELRADMDGRFAGVRAEMNTRFAEARTEMNTRFSETDVRFAQFETKLGKMKNQLVFWILGAMVGNNYLPQIVTTLTDAVAGVIRSFH